MSLPLAFFGTKAPLAVDLFLVTMVAILPLMGLAIVRARQHRFRSHATLMVASFVMFVISLVAFEGAVRTMDDKPDLPKVVLTIHLCFAVPGLLLWIWQLKQAKRARKNPAAHRRLGRIVLGFLVLTVATGIWVYVAMFG